MYDVTQLAEHDVYDIRAALRTHVGSTATCMEDAAHAVVHAFHTLLRDPLTDAASCALVRCYITQRYDDLTPQLQRLAHANLDAVKYLVLLASVGEHPAWNDRTRSTAHQLLPLSSVTMVQQSPMIARMIKQFGFTIDTLISTNGPELSMLPNRTHNIFYVPTAAGSPFIPAQQEFVQPYGIKSVVGMGGILPYGHMFAVILFAKVAIPPSAIPMFATLSTDIKMLLVPYGDKRIFAGPP